MITGQQYTVSVSMKNTGSTTWTSTTNFRLGSQNPRDNTTWLKPANRVNLASGDSIATNQTKTFTFTVTAPSTPGTYNFQWQMVQEGVAWFGDMTQNVAVNVQAGGSKPTTPSNPNPSSGTTLARTNNTTLSWSTNGTSCQVFVQGGSTNISPTGNCSSLAFGAQRGGSYSWYVKATNSYGTTTGPTWTFNVRPHGISNLNATTASANQINLNWTLSSDDNGTDIDEYNIYRDGVYIASVTKGVSSYAVTGLACNTSYSFFIRAKRQGVQSEASSTVSRTTSACAPSTPTLNAPANNTVLNRNDSISLSWNTASGASAYYAEFWGGPSLNLNSGWVTGTSWNIGSTWGGVYQWRVKSRNSSGVESGWSETRTLTVRYGTPASLSASGVSTSQINLSWGASADAPGNIQGYRIYRNGTAIATVGNSTTSYNDTSVTCNSSYSYTVRAYKGDLESNASNTASTSPSGCPPVAPSNLTVSNVTASSITLSWQDNASNESGFRVYRWSNGANGWAFYLFATVGANTTTYTQNGLDCGNDFNFYEIAAYNNNGESARVGWVQGATSACPAPVNDDFNAPKVISTSTYTDTLDTRGATVASDDPELTICGLGQGVATVWYKFTPSVSGQIQIDTIGSTYDTILAVWTGTRGSLTAQDCNDDRLDEYGSFVDTKSALTINVQAGVPYYIEAAQFSSASTAGMSAQSGQKVVTDTEMPGPNDELNGQGADLSGLAVGGTLKLNFKFAQADLIITSMSVSPANPPAYQPATVTLQIRNQGQAPATEFWVDLFVNRQPQACQSVSDYWNYIDSIRVGETLTVTIPISNKTADGLAQGTHQLVAYADVDCLVGESNEANNQYGPLYLTVGAPLPTPANDDFYAAKTITTPPYTDTLDTRGATVAFDDPMFGACELNAGKGTAWYRFTPATSGMVKIETMGSDYDTVLGLFTGTRGNLTLIGCNDDIEINGQWNPSSSLFLNLNAGVTYYINIAKYGGFLDVGGDGLDAQESRKEFSPVLTEKETELSDSDLSGLSGGTLNLSVKTDFFDYRAMLIDDFNYNAGWRMSDHPRMMADVNGDGKADIVGFGSSGVWVSLSTGTKFSTRTMWINDFNYNAGWRMTDHPRMMADVNNDGRADIVGFGSSGVWVSLSTGTNFAARTMWINDYNYNAGWRMSDHPRMMADVNDDGRADIVGFGNSGVWVSLSTGTAFAARKMWIDDFNYNAGWRMTDHPRMMADVNNDGRADIVGFGSSGVWVSLSTGTNFAARTMWINDFNYNAGWRMSDHPRMMADVNNDGRADIVGFGSSGVWVSLSTGTNFAARTMWINDFNYNAGWRMTDHPRMMADVDGDGRDDIIGFGSSGVWVSNSKAR
jgi:hypothetical protein